MSETVESQEQRLQFEDFGSEDAAMFAKEVVSWVKENRTKDVGIRISRDGLVILQYLMDGKKEDNWLKRKERTVLESGHASLYVFEHIEEYPQMKDNDRYCVGGGGFPLIIQGSVRGAVCVSGLVHTEDHALIVQMLKKVKLAKETAKQ